MNKILNTKAVRSKGQKQSVAGWLVLSVLIVLSPNRLWAAPCTGDLTARINCLNTKLKYISMETDAGGKPVLKITGANVRILSQASNDNTGNLIVGNDHDWSNATSGFVAGNNNTIVGTGTTIIGGRENTAVGDGATICGGLQNETTVSAQSAVGGGYLNAVEGSYDVIIGGSENHSTGNRSTIIGGYLNANMPADGGAATIKGGSYAELDGGAYASILGGDGNRVTGAYTSVAGGWSNAAYGMYGATIGGWSNRALDFALATGVNNGAGGLYSTIAAGNASWTYADYGTVCGGRHSHSDTNDHDDIPLGIAPTVSGGYRALAMGDYSSNNGGAFSETIVEYGWAAGELSQPAGGGTGCTCPSGCDTVVDRSIPFSLDGPGNTCYFFSNFNYMNNWNNVKVDINGVDSTNVYVPSGGHPIPAKSDGGYYIYYKGDFAWSHIEVK